MGMPSLERELKKTQQALAENSAKLVANTTSANELAVQLALSRPLLEQTVELLLKVLEPVPVEIPGKVSIKVKSET